MTTSHIVTVEEMTEQLLKDGKKVDEEVLESMELCKTSWKFCLRKALRFTKKRKWQLSNYRRGRQNY